MSVFRWLSRGMVPAARYLNSCPNPCGNTVGKNWNVNGQSDLSYMLDRDLDKHQVMLCPQWHLRSMKDHLPASVLWCFLFSFGVICFQAVQEVFQVSKLKKLTDTERFMEVF